MLVLDQKPKLWRNETPREGRHWLLVRTVGTRGNKDGIGARVSVHLDDRVLVREVRTAQSYLCQGDLRQHFGLGERTVVPRLEVRWPAALRDGQDYSEQSLIALNGGKVERAPVAAVGSPGFLQRLFSGAAPGEVATYRGDVGWAGVDLRYFVVALAPDLGRSAAVRFEPSDTGTTHYTATPGTVVEVLAERNGWAQVARRGDRLRGWVQLDAIERL